MDTSGYRSAGRVFIIHGHKDAAKHEVARVVRALTGHEPVILHEQPNEGQVLIEKFEAAASATDFAVALLTADDVGRANDDDDLNPRARQNVVFELGFFFGAFGRSRVAVLVESGVEQPSDVSGLVYTTLDPRGAWKLDLARELEAEGFEIDWSALR